MNTQISTQTITFYDAELITLKVEDVIYTAVKPIVDALGLSWGTQQRKLENSKDKFSCTHMKTTGSDGKTYEMLCMPIRKLNGWLFSINPEKVRPDLKDRVIKYQEECFEALYNYWFKGKAERTQTTVDDRTGLRDAVNMLVSKKGLIYSDAYNLVHQYMNVKSIDEISKVDLPKAVAYCHKLVLEGELIIEQPKAENFSLTANDVVELAWCLFSAKQQNDLLQMLVKPLDEIKSGYSSEVYTFASEYRHCWQLSFPILDKLVALIDKSTSDTNYKRIVMHFKKIRDDLNKPALMFRT
ncbi:phage antirepressor N-terminal domain-containing protein, partial [Gallibacterium genomosp. 3]|uniref:phage antirepressor N-terminal domain-containing protein n=1 Tax=Gallibacterium genomosp. 3 TaxID=505345 RepID=UPI0008026D3C